LSLDGSALTVVSQAVPPFFFCSACEICKFLHNCVWQYQ